LSGLRAQLAGRNLLGSGKEFAATSDIAQFGAGKLADQAREQAIQDALAAEQRAGREYEGRITQRGQDIGLMRAREAAAAAREQWAREQRARSYEQLMKMLEGLY
jgi:hypothetical protein